jgi:hypothetical protein
MAVKFYSPEAEAAASRILEAFEHPDTLPQALAQIVLATGERHADNYSHRNQLIVWIMNYTDAAGYKQWLNDYGRQVRKGEKSFAILAPVTKKFFVTERDAETGQERKRPVTQLVGWRDVRVFGIEQTDIANVEKWEKYAAANAENTAFVERLPWTEVARSWGLAVAADGRLEKYGAHGCYTHGRGIEVAVENLSTWAHELIHAADDRLGCLTKKPGQQPDNEIVAEVGGAVLCTVAGYGHEADIGGAWEYIKKYSKDPLQDAGKLIDRIITAVSLVLAQAETPDAVIEPAA